MICKEELKTLKKEMPANNIPDEVDMKAGAIARSLMVLPPLLEEELIKRVKLAEKSFKKCLCLYSWRHNFQIIYYADRNIEIARTYNLG